MFKIKLMQVGVQLRSRCTDVINCYKYGTAVTNTAVTLL